LLTWFMLVGSIFLVAPQSLTSKFQFTFARLFRWPLSFGRSISLYARPGQPRNDVVSRKRYNQLQNHLAAVIAQRNEEHKKVEKLSGLRNRLPLEGVKLMVADVVTASIDNLHAELIINRGTDDHLARGQFVLGDNSIVGIIFEVSARTARVRLITDPISRIPVTVAEPDADGIMHGTGSNYASVPLLPVKLDIKVGDVVYAQKNPGFLDAPMKVGVVAHCTRDQEKPLLWQVTVKPACDIKKLKSVAIIVMNP